MVATLSGDAASHELCEGDEGPPQPLAPGDVPHAHCGAGSATEGRRGLGWGSALGAAGDRWSVGLARSSGAQFGWRLACCALIHTTHTAVLLGWRLAGMDAAVAGRLRRMGGPSGISLRGRTTTQRRWWPSPRLSGRYRRKCCRSSVGAWVAALGYDCLRAALGCVAGWHAAPQRRAPLGSSAFWESSSWGSCADGRSRSESRGAPQRARPDANVCARCSRSHTCANVARQGVHSRAFARVSRASVGASVLQLACSAACAERLDTPPRLAVGHAGHPASALRVQTRRG